MTHHETGLPSVCKKFVGHFKEIVMIGTKRQSLMLAVIGGSLLGLFSIHGGEQNRTSVEMESPMDHRLLKTRRSDPAQIYPESADDTKITFEGQTIAVYRFDLPSYGISQTEVDGWIFLPEHKMWQCLFSTRIHAVGRNELLFDDQSGRLSLVGRANNKFKDVEVFMYDLRVATP
jgi:hypothetical protein